MKKRAICYFYVFENTSKLSSRNSIDKRYKQEPHDAMLPNFIDTLCSSSKLDYFCFQSNIAT